MYDLGDNKIDPSKTISEGKYNIEGTKEYLGRENSFLSQFYQQFLHLIQD